MIRSTCSSQHYTCRSSHGTVDTSGALTHSLLLSEQKLLCFVGMPHHVLMKHTPLKTRGEGTYSRGPSSPVGHMKHEDVTTQTVDSCVPSLGSEQNRLAHAVQAGEELCPVPCSIMRQYKEPWQQHRGIFRATAPGVLSGCIVTVACVARRLPGHHAPRHRA